MAFTDDEIKQILDAFLDLTTERQYIGARYVPIFGRKDEDSIIWDNTKPYEPLTIVLYQGNSYTSRQYVPIGVEIANNEFWAQTGNYNAQIEVYLNAVQNLQEEVSDLSDSVNQDIQTAITMLEKQHRILLLGDSWTDINSATVFDNTNWTTYFAKNYQNVQLYNYAVGGGGFLAGTTFYNQLQTALADEDFNADEITEVFIIGAINDWTAGNTSAASYTSAITQLVNAIHTNLPNAKATFFFASCARPLSHTGDTSVTGNWRDLHNLNRDLKRYLEVTAGNNNMCEAYIITYCFPEKTFIPWGNANYMRHLSKEGHWQLMKAISHCWEKGYEPTMYAYCNGIANASVFSFDIANFAYNHDDVYIKARFTTKSDINQTDSVYQPVLDSDFMDRSSRQYLATFSDIFTPGATYQEEAAYTIFTLSIDKYISKCIPTRNTVVSEKDLELYFGVGYGFNNKNSGFLLIAPDAINNPIPSNSSFTVEFTLDAVSYTSQYIGNTSLIHV